MDFHSLTRKELQFLCKLNKIRANITNVGMADALQSLDIVKGIEKFIKVTQSETSNLDESKENVDELSSPKVPKTRTRTINRKNVTTTSCGNVNSQLNDCELEVKEDERSVVTKSRKKVATNLTAVKKVATNSTAVKTDTTRRSTRQIEKKFGKTRGRKESEKAVEINSMLDVMNVVSDEVLTVKVPENTVNTGNANVEVEDICNAFEELVVVVDDVYVSEEKEYCGEIENLKPESDEISNVDEESVLEDTKPEPNGVSNPCLEEDNFESETVVMEEQPDGIIDIKSQIESGGDDLQVDAIIHCNIEKFNLGHEGVFCGVSDMNTEAPCELNSNSTPDDENMDDETLNLTPTIDSIYPITYEVVEMAVAVSSEVTDGSFMKEKSQLSPNPTTFQDSFSSRRLSSLSEKKLSVRKEVEKIDSLCDDMNVTSFQEVIVDADAKIQDVCSSFRKVDVLVDQSAEEKEEDDNVKLESDEYSNPCENEDLEEKRNDDLKPESDEILNPCEKVAFEEEKLQLVPEQHIESIHNDNAEIQSGERLLSGSSSTMVNDMILDNNESPKDSFNLYDDVNIFSPIENTENSAHDENTEGMNVIQQQVDGETLDVISTIDRKTDVFTEKAEETNQFCKNQSSTSRTTNRKNVKTTEPENLHPTETRLTARQLADGIEESCRNVNNQLNDCEIEVKEDDKLVVTNTTAVKKESSVQKPYTTTSQIEKKSKAVEISLMLDEMNVASDEVLTVQVLESTVNADVEDICNALDNLNEISDVQEEGVLEEEENDLRPNPCEKRVIVEEKLESGGIMVVEEHPDSIMDDNSHTESGGDEGVFCDVSIMSTENSNSSSVDKNIEQVLENMAVSSEVTDGFEAVTPIMPVEVVENTMDAVAKMEDASSFFEKLDVLVKEDEVENLDEISNPCENRDLEEKRNDDLKPESDEILNPCEKVAFEEEKLQLVPEQHIESIHNDNPEIQSGSSSTMVNDMILDSTENLTDSSNLDDDVNNFSPNEGTEGIIFETTEKAEATHQSLILIDVAGGPTPMKKFASNSIVSDEKEKSAIVFEGCLIKENNQLSPNPTTLQEAYSSTRSTKEIDSLLYQVKVVLVEDVENPMGAGDNQPIFVDEKLQDVCNSFEIVDQSAEEKEEDAVENLDGLSNPCENADFEEKQKYDIKPESGSSTMVNYLIIDNTENPKDSLNKDDDVNTISLNDENTNEIMIPKNTENSDKFNPPAHDENTNDDDIEEDMGMNVIQQQVDGETLDMISTIDVFTDKTEAGFVENQSSVLIDVAGGPTSSINKFVSDDKENNSAIVFGNNNKKDKKGAIVFEDLSLRQLRKQFKNLKLKTINANSQDAASKVVGATARPALQALCDNQLVGGQTNI